MAGPTWTEQIIVEINGTDRTAYVKRGSLTVEDVASTRAVSVRSCRFGIVNGAALSLEKMQLVEVRNSAGARRYKGFIVDLTETQVKGAKLNYEVTCEGYAWQLGNPEELYDGDFSGESDATILATVLATTNPDIDTATYVQEIDDDLSENFDYVTGLEAVQKVAEKTGAVWYVDDGPADVVATGASELLSNPGFETLGGGGADVYANWTETAGTGAIADEGTIVHGGSHAAKLTAGSSTNTLLAQNAAVVAGRRYCLSFWARGDGTYAGRYGLYDVTNAATILATTSTGVTGTAYALVSFYFTAPAGCASVQVRLRCSATDTAICYFDDVSLKIAYHAALHYFLSPLDDRTEILVNGDLETAGAGGADVFGTWAETAGDGAIADETTLVHSGSHAAKLTAGATRNTVIQQTVTVLPLTAYRWAFWTRGDGIYAGRYRVYDLTNSADIVASTSTGVTGTTYTLVQVTFTTPAGCTSIYVRWSCPNTDTGVAYFDDATLRRDYPAEWSLLGDTWRSDGAYYTGLQIISKAPEANRLIVRGAGTVLRTVTRGLKTDYGRWITRLHADKSLKTNAQADAAGAAKLEAMASQPSYKLRTYRHGLFAGQCVQLTNSLGGLSAEYLDIKRVSYAWEGAHDGTTNWLCSCDLELGKFLPRLPDVLSEAGGAGGKIDDLEWELDHLELAGALATITASHAFGGALATSTLTHAFSGTSESEAAYSAVVTGYTTTTAWGCFYTNGGTGPNTTDHHHTYHCPPDNHSHNFEESVCFAAILAHDHGVGSYDSPDHEGVVTGIGTLAVGSHGTVVTGIGTLAVAVVTT